MNKGRSQTRSVSPVGGPTKESPRASKDAPLSGRAGESPRASKDAPLSGRPDAALNCKAVIRNQRGLHARAAAKFVKLAGQFAADIRVSRAGQTVSGHSIMGLMMLGAGPGMEIELETRGPAARAALGALNALIDAGFDEKD